MKGWHSAAMILRTFSNLAAAAALAAALPTIAIAQDKAIWHIPPAETLFVQRKVSGTALLGARIGAVVNIHAIVRDVLERTGDLS